MLSRAAASRAYVLRAVYLCGATRAGLSSEHGRGGTVQYRGQDSPPYGAQAHNQEVYERATGCGECAEIVPTPMPIVPVARRSGAIWGWRLARDIKAALTL